MTVYILSGYENRTGISQVLGVFRSLQLAQERFPTVWEAEDHNLWSCDFAKRPESWRKVSRAEYIKYLRHFGLPEWAVALSIEQHELT